MSGETETETQRAWNRKNSSACCGRLELAEGLGLDFETLFSGKREAFSPRAGTRFFTSALL